MQPRILAGAVLASLAAAGSLAVAQGAGATTKAKVVRGVIYGGVTAQDYPIVLELSKTGRQVVKASIVMDLKCKAPPAASLPDRYTKLPISAAGKFSYTAPVTRIPADPGKTPALDVSGMITGQVDKAKTRIKGTWQLKVVAYDPTDPTGVAVLDSCDSGVLRYTARQ
ncbi:MAG: hypothetical protein QOJ63_2647 [Solirubrobacteraceae bacterium]|nr:hypothetical protein [Solirubrobacteraceae bacterium]